MSYLQDDKPITLFELGKMRADGRKIAMLTGYDASFAALLERCGVDVILIGDSLGNVLQGQKSTLPVTLDHMVYHTESVVRGCRRPFIVTDMPFGSYHESPAQAMRSAARLMAAGAQMVKLEGGEFMAETVRFLVERGVPVCAHIGLTPQSVHQLGGYRVQGRDDSGAARLKADALALEQAGAALMVMEMVPATVAAEITSSLQSMASIGIGAGPSCDGQVLVLHDLLGVYPGKTARFVRNFMQGADSIDSAVAAYVSAVKDGSFPAPEHCY
ncbi:3-methyl-2-oxobutanoate hydroxymethyltransferase [Parazoarcus communis]|uniref:3-methyl-2-oxobutanoate hydroxymethyltransferase n=1 Tax=Parazoarcus communis SWub3 = DSM 12120 TaxID=1121029 RepID=A0A323V0P7_9RHOO|nr:3-methyl-2-oxobutanoate hydroxymethyltransferase [Parazoarcus communis]NMG69778.1 3-methyl-2-oxobutanoate hydroxymethyltransferase [Parazoarcus communis SWub3 = DSM 12120]PZA18071.1 3-methyl-2-oxobutanoate hydroxymethyltransferase [Azoarcus communis] [Parazoarcus communis SWub3 = DSM 12120]